MFGVRLSSFRVNALAGLAVSALTVLAPVSAAFAGDRGHGGSYGHGGYGDRGGFSHRDGYGYRSGSRFGLSINLGGPVYGGYCAPYAYRPYLPPPVVYARPYCPPPVIYSPPVVYAAPQVIERPVYVDRPVVVEKQVVVEREVDRVPEPAPRVVYAQSVPPAGEVRVSPEASKYQDRELGDTYLRLGDADNAARVYRRYLSGNASDGTAYRNFGIALLARGESQEGFKAFASGYRIEPQLFTRAFRVSDLGTPQSLDRTMDAAVRGATSVNTAEGWFTLAMLNTLAGQREQALNASQKAKEAGLENTLLDALTLRISQLPAEQVVR